MSVEQNKKDNGPDLKISPPALFSGFFVSCLILEYVLPTSLGIGSPSMWVGTAGMISGFWISMLSVSCFRKAGTHIRVNSPSLKLVTNGPYARSRNPIYLGLLLIYISLGFSLDSLWIFLSTPLLFFVLQRSVVMKEEAYLRILFPEAYQHYYGRVPRWL